MFCINSFKTNEGYKIAQTAFTRHAPLSWNWRSVFDCVLLKQICRGFNYLVIPRLVTVTHMKPKRREKEDITAEN